MHRLMLLVICHLIGDYFLQSDFITSPLTNYKLEYEFLSSGEIKALVDDRQRAANDWNRKVGNGV